MILIPHLAIFEPWALVERLCTKVGLRVLYKGLLRDKY